MRKKELSSITNLYVTPVTHLGLLLGTSTLARLMPQLGLLVILCILPLLLLSVGASPRESMPPLVQSIMLGALTTYFVRLAQGIPGIDMI